MSGGGGSGSDGGGDMQVSGMEAAVSQEKGISTHADTRVSRDSFSPGVGPSEDRGGHHDTRPALGPDTSTVGSVENFRVNPNTGKVISGAYSQREIERGITDQGEKLDQVGAGQYMTKSQQYSTGLIEKDPETGRDVQGRYRVNPNTGDFERTDMSFGDHWKNAPDSLKYSPTLRLLYASGKNIGEWSGKKGFEGYNEAGLKTGNIWGGSGSGGDGNNNTGGNGGGGGDGERARMNTIAPHAPYIVAGTTKPTNSPAANWYAGSLGNTPLSGNTFDLATEFAAAKSKQTSILGNSSAVGMLAANQTPYFDFLQKHNLTKGIL
ncbi:hypothetical protein OAJ72_03180 [Pelagibacteraceae bacterium]|nr:hypothetical protein [Pelagibacteraceae bacterium]